MESILPSDNKIAEEKAKREIIFCEEYIRTGDVVGAVVKAGIRAVNYPIDVVGRQLLERPDIKLAIRMLTDRGVTSAPVEYTRDSLVSDMQNIYQDAREAGRFESAISAKRLQAALLGYLVDRKEITLVKSAQEMTNDELRRIAYKGKVVEGEAVESE